MKNTKYTTVLKEIKALLSHDTKSLLSIEYIDSKLQEVLTQDEGAKECLGANLNFPLPNMDKMSTHEFFLYSDGACRGNPGPGAWGAMAQNVKGEVIYQSSAVLNPTTNNQMELEGAIQALKFIISKNRKEKISLDDIHIHLFSDSKYVIDGLKSWAQGWKKRGWKKADKKPPENLEYWKRIDDLRVQTKNIKYYWVKGHAGHPQNEYCDLLANQALDKNGY